MNYFASLNSVSVEDGKVHSLSPTHIGAVKAKLHDMCKAFRKGCVRCCQYCSAKCWWLVCISEVDYCISSVDKEFEKHEESSVW